MGRGSRTYRSNGGKDAQEEGNARVQFCIYKHTRTHRKTYKCTTVRSNRAACSYDIPCWRVSQKRIFPQPTNNNGDVRGNAEYLYKLSNVTMCQNRKHTATQRAVSNNGVGDHIPTYQPTNPPTNLPTYLPTCLPTFAPIVDTHPIHRPNIRSEVHFQ